MHDASTRACLRVLRLHIAFTNAEESSGPDFEYDLIQALQVTHRMESERAEIPSKTVRTSFDRKDQVRENIRLAFNSAKQQSLRRCYRLLRNERPATL